MTEQLTSLVHEFVTASDWDELVRILGQHPELLTDEADAVLATLIEDARERGAIDLVDRLQGIAGLLRRWRAIGVEAAIDEIRRARPQPLHAELAALFDRAVEASESYEQGGGVHTLLAAVETWQELLRHPALGDARADFRVGVTSNASVSLMRLYFETGRLEHLETAVAHLERVLADVPAGSADQRMVLNNLGAALQTRYRVTHVLTDLNRALEVFSRILANSPADDPERPGWLSNLGVVLERRYRHTGDADDLRRAIEVLEEAVREAPAEHPERPGFLKNLADAYSARYRSGGDPADLDRSIEAFEAAVSGTPIGHPERPSYQSGLGGGLDLRYQRTSDPHDLDRAIGLHREALAAMLPRSPGRSLALNSLGNCLRFRYYRTGDLDDLDRALDAYRQAIDETPPAAPDRLTYLQNISIAWNDHHDRSGDLEDLERAIEAAQESVDGTPVGVPERLARTQNLANALLSRYRRTGDLDDVERTIAIAQNQVEARDQSPMDQAISRNLLGNGLIYRYRRTRDPETLRRATDAYEGALAALPAASPERALFLSNLGSVRLHRHERTGDPEDLRRAAETFRAACTLGLQTRVEWALHAASIWGDWAFGRSAWSEASEAYRFGAAAVQSLFRTQLTRGHKEVWLGEAQGMSTRAAYATAKAGDLKAAVELLEQGRAQLLSEALDRGRIDLGQLQGTGDGDLAVRYRQLADRLADLERAGLDPTRTGGSGAPMPSAAERSDAIREVRAGLDAVIEEIRRVPGHERFLEPPGFGDVAAVSATPVVYLISTAAGGLALVVRDGAVAPLWLPELTETVLRDRMRTYLEALEAYSQSLGLEAWGAVLDRTTAWLWGAAMGAVVEALGGAGRVLLIPAGLLGLLPLHAAWTEDATGPSGRRYVLDVLLPTYAPNARAAQPAARMATDQAPDGVLAVGDPRSEDAPPLPHAAREAGFVRSSFPNGRLLMDAEATRSAVLGEVGDWPVLHFACHGSMSSTEPLDSSLLLAHGQRLTLRDVMGGHLAGTRLAVLSACDTALPGAELPDEVIGLPVGFLQAGVTGVVGSLWPVADASTAMLMSRFYRSWRRGGLEPAEALRSAQRWLRGASNADLQAAFPEVAGTPSALSPALRDFWDSAVRYAHPHYWAAFTYTGH